MTTGVSLKEVDTGANACSVEYCPVPGFEAYVACSTYVLDASRGGDHGHADSNLDTKTGSTPPFDVVDDAGAVAAASASRASSTCDDDAEGGDAIVGQTRTGTITIYKVSGVSTSLYGNRIRGNAVYLNTLFVFGWLLRACSTCSWVTFDESVLAFELLVMSSGCGHITVVPYSHRKRNRTSYVRLTAMNWFGLP